MELKNGGRKVKFPMKIYTSSWGKKFKFREIQIKEEL